MSLASLFTSLWETIKEWVGLLGDWIWQICYWIASTVGHFFVVAIEWSFKQLVELISGVPPLGYGTTACGYVATVPDTVWQLLSACGFQTGLFFILSAWVTRFIFRRVFEVAT